MDTFSLSSLILCKRKIEEREYSTTNISDWLFGYCPRECTRMAITNNVLNINYGRFGTPQWFSDLRYFSCCRKWLFCVSIIMITKTEIFKEFYFKRTLKVCYKKFWQKKKVLMLKFLKKNQFFVGKI